MPTEVFIEQLKEHLEKTLLMARESLRLIKASGSKDEQFALNFLDELNKISVEL